MSRKCKECGGIIGSVPETTCMCQLLRVDIRDGKQFVATQTELRTIIETMENGVSSDLQDGMNKKQQIQNQRDRICERFLISEAFVRSLCQEFGMADLTNDLVPMLCGLQVAHERLVKHHANRMLVEIVKGIQTKVITVEHARKLFQLDEAALAVLIQRLDEAPKQDLVDHLSGLKGLESRRDNKKWE